MPRRGDNVAVRRWLPWLALPLIACGLIFANRAAGPGLLADTDTRVLLEAIRERQDPLSWFSGDWPLENHFYRPISTLFFEMDNALYGDASAGYGQTNALLAIACVLLLFWLVREATGIPWLAGSSSALFGLHHLSPSHYQWLWWIGAALAGIAAAGFFRFGFRRLGYSLLIALAGLFAGSMLMPIYGLESRMILWLPGRTASVMTVFCLIAMAAYTRYERLSAPRVLAKATSTDIPLTKGDEKPSPRAKKTAWTWAGIALLATALALGSYEQAIMLPGAILGLAIILRVHHKWRVRWAWHGGFWALLLGYVGLRMAVVPTDASGYQAQQFRDGPGVIQDLLRYIVPEAWNLAMVADIFTLGAMVLLTPTIYQAVIGAVGNVSGYWAGAVSKNRWLFWGFLALALVTFLPMAWLKFFAHYHYWPHTMRAVWSVLLVAAVAKAALSAASPPSQQAPARSDPAPGSLPRQ